MKLNKRFAKAVTAATLACFTLSPMAFAAGKDNARPLRNKAKNIIFMVPDGMGLSYVTAARIFLNGEDGAPLSFETLNQIGYQRTHSLDSGP